MVGFDGYGYNIPMRGCVVVVPPLVFSNAPYYDQHMFWKGWNLLGKFPVVYLECRGERGSPSCIPGVCYRLRGS